MLPARRKGDIGGGLMVVRLAALRLCKTGLPILRIYEDI
jgi:hypothetical protein